jgi:hypothetical protein
MLHRQTSPHQFPIVTDLQIATHDEILQQINFTLFSESLINFIHQRPGTSPRLSTHTMISPNSFAGISANDISLMANVSPVCQLRALKTLAEAPFPSGSPSCYMSHRCLWSVVARHGPLIPLLDTYIIGHGQPTR